MIERCDLGRTGIKIPRIGFGCWTIGGHGWGKVDDAESIRAVRRAVEVGIDYFDTADVYGFGHSERILAKALGAGRKDVFIATKGGVKWDKAGRISHDIGPDSILEAIHGSLRRLKLDCIPLYQLHWPDGKTRLSETMATLMRCREAGKIRYVGCCNMNLEQIKELHSYDPLATIQVSYNLLDRSAKSMLLPSCRSLGITPLAWGPLAHGFLTGKCGPASGFGKDDIRSRVPYFQDANYKTNLLVVEKIRGIAERRGKTVTQVALRWVLDTIGGGCALTGIRSPEQIEENIGAMGWKLGSADLRILNGPSLETDPKALRAHG